MHVKAVSAPFRWVALLEDWGNEQISSNRGGWFMQVVNTTKKNMQ